MTAFMTFIQPTFDRWFARTGFTWARTITLVKFMAAGLPSFVIAVPANYLLVSHARLGKPLAYAIVMAMQVTINFFMCRRFVFGGKAAGPLARQFIAFFTGIMAFRVADWLLYVMLVNVVGLYYLAAQCLNVAVFGIAKFVFSERVFARRDATRIEE